MEEEPRKIELEYARVDPTRALKILRAVKLGMAIILPPMLLFMWALIGGAWWRRSYRSAGYSASTYDSIFLDGPLWVGTVLLGMVAIFVVVMVVRRRWLPSWLAAVPAIIVAWFAFGLMMAWSHVLP